MCKISSPALPADQSAEAASCRCKRRLPRRIRSFAAGFADAAAASCTAQLRRHLSQTSLQCDPASCRCKQGIPQSCSQQLKLSLRQNLHEPAVVSCDSQTCLQCGSHSASCDCTEGFPEQFAACCTDRPRCCCCELFAGVDGRRWEIVATLCGNARRPDADSATALHYIQTPPLSAHFLEFLFFNR